MERSKNGNFVRYDVCLTEKDNVIDSNPVTVYWVLDNGRQEELNLLEKKYAYGIASQDKIGDNRFRVLLVAFKNREVIVEKSDGFFRAIVSIDGKQSILEKVYVKSKERSMGFPQILYVDLFGKTMQENLPVRERIIAGHGQKELPSQNSQEGSKHVERAS